jgi:hypothetical protein
VAWQHINLCGRYEGTKGLEAINLPAIMQALVQASMTQTRTRQLLEYTFLGGWAKTPMVDLGALKKAVSQQHTPRRTKACS